MREWRQRDRPHRNVGHVSNSESNNMRIRLNKIRRHLRNLLKIITNCKIRDINHSKITILKKVVA